MCLAAVTCTGSMGMNPSIAFLNTINLANPLPLAIAPAGPQQLRFRADPGLYQFSAILDAREFDGESLYENLFIFDNAGQRTGPWDFKLGKAIRWFPPIG